MGKRRSDADSRRFFDEFEKVRISRFRAEGTVDPSRPTALIKFPGGKTKLLGVAHVAFAKGGGWSYFICPGCGDKRTPTLYLIDDAPRCRKCCDAMNIKDRSRYGRTRDERRKAADRHLDEIIAKVQTETPLRLSATPASWGGKAKLAYNTRNLINAMRRSMVTLRLGQLATQRASGSGVRSFEPIAATKQLVEIKPIWQARTPERLQRALDQAQTTIIAALNSEDASQRLAAAKLMLRTRQARERSLA